MLYAVMTDLPKSSWGQNFRRLWRNLPSLESMKSSIAAELHVVNLARFGEFLFRSLAFFPPHRQFDNH